MKKSIQSSLHPLLLTACASLFLAASCGEKQNTTIQPINVAALLKQNPSIKPVVVIGGGVAGLTAANYLMQANIPCLILEGSKPGGALAQSDSVRNWPGVFDAPGAIITNSLKDQAVLNGAIIQAKSLVNIDTKQIPFVLTVQDDSGQQETIRTFSCIIAMGAKPNYLGVPGESGEDGYWGRGVSNCAVCDGALFKNKVVAIVGGGDSAMVEASYLAGLAKQVYVLVRGDALKASDKRKVEQVKGLKNVSFMYNAAVKSIHGDGKVVTHLELSTTELEVDGLFLAIGATPNTKLFADQIKCDTAGYISLIKGQETSVPGIFAAGDICDPFVKQAVTASSMGCQAALQAKEYLDSIGWGDVVAELGPRLRKDDEDKRSEKVEKIAHLETEITSLATAKKLCTASSKQLLVVDIYGTYCIPCQKMAPIFASCAQDYAGKVSFAKLDISSKAIDSNEFVRLVGTDEIMTVPTFLFIKKGKVVLRKNSSMSKNVLTELIESVI